MIEVRKQQINSYVTINGIGYEFDETIDAYSALHGDREFSMFEADIQADIVINGTSSNKTGIMLYRSNQVVEDFLNYIKSKIG